MSHHLHLNRTNQFPSTRHNGSCTCYHLPLLPHIGTRIDPAIVYLSSQVVESATVKSIKKVIYTSYI